VPEASVGNPVDMVAGATGREYAAALSILREDPDVDGLLVLFVSPVMINAVEVARAIIQSGAGARQPILTCFMGKEQGRQGVAELRAAGIPVYLFPEDAARALAGLDLYRRVRERPEGSVPRFAVDTGAADRIVQGARAARREILTAVETATLLRAYGFPMVTSRAAATVEDAVSAAAEIGFPVVVKAAGEGIVHKSDVGGVRLDLRTRDEVDAACRGIAGALGARPFHFEVQPMVAGGRETILGLTHDPKFGALLMFGLGGIFVEVMKDVVFRLLPITDAEARAMIRGIRGYPLLQGARGEAPVDEAFLEEMLLRLAQLAIDRPEIDQVDINPLIVGPAARAVSPASCVVDARVRLLAPADGAASRS
jgi:acetyltransferase